MQIWSNILYKEFKVTIVIINIINESHTRGVFRTQSKQLRRNFLQKIAILQKGFLADVRLGSKHVVAYAFTQTVWPYLLLTLKQRNNFRSLKSDHGVLNLPKKATYHKLSRLIWINATVWIVVYNVIVTLIMFYCLLLVSQILEKDILNI